MKEMKRTGYCTMILFLSFGIFILQINFLVTDGSVLLSPSPALATDGEPFTMSCIYSGSETVSGFTWQLNGNTVATILIPSCKPFGNPGPPDSSLYSYACPSDEQTDFTVKQISNTNNDDSWQCAAAVPVYIYSNSVNIVVQVTVSSVSLTPPKGSIIENVESSFTCDTSTSRPAATITWYRELTTGIKQEITSNISTTIENVGDLIKTRSVLKYTPSRDDNGYKMYCEAVNIAGGASVYSDKFPINVLYSPDGPPEIQNFPSGGTCKVIEKNQCRLVCMIRGGNPLATLVWNCFNNGLPTVTNGTTVTRTVTWNATRGPGRLCTCLSSHPLDLTQSVSINVHILYMAIITSFTVQQNQRENQSVSATVNESDRVEFECIVDSNPGSTIEIQTGDKQLKRKENTKTLTYSVPVASCLDAGVYTCSARNEYNLGERSEKTLNLFVRCSPRPLNTVNENLTAALWYPATLTFKGLAYPTPTFSWMKKEAGEWRALTNTSNVSIFTSGADSNLTINNVTILDFGEYQLKVENVIRAFIQPYYLSPEKVPETPSEFHVVEEHIAGTFALLRWKPGFNGGISQTFILKYKKSSDQGWLTTEVEDTREGLIIYTLHNLDSSSLYTVVLFARNRAGDSAGSQNITFSTKDTKIDVDKEASSAISGGVIGGIVGGIVLCVLVVAVSCYLSRRNMISCKGLEKESSNKSTTGGQSQDDYFEENTSNVNASYVYDSLQTESGVTADISNQRAYMSLDKGNKDDDKNVYSELEEQPDNSEEKREYANMEVPTFESQMAISNDK